VVTSAPQIIPTFVQIGGETIELPPIITFDVLERAWPSVRAFRAASQAGDPVAQIAAAIGICAAALVEKRPELSVPEIKKRLRVGSVAGDERDGLLVSMVQLLERSGLISPAGQKSGEQEPSESGPTDSPTSSPTTSTSNTSSPS
jgi:hypothetical protein